MAADEKVSPAPRRRLGIQGRLTVAATLLVAFVLLGASIALTLFLRLELQNTLNDSARQRARDVATLIDTGNLPNTVPAVGGVVVVQVVDELGRVRAATPGGDALVPLLSGKALHAAADGVPQELPGSRIGISDEIHVVGTTAGPPDDRLTVLVGVSAAEAERSVKVLSVILSLSVPVLVAAFGIACWFLVGAALRPVAALRRGADAISETGTGARLPVPATRDEVARLAETLNDMLDRLAAASARQRAFVADAAHELRSPLASIRTQLEVGRQHPEVTDWADTADGVLADVQRLTRLVDDLLLLARLDDDRPRRHVADVDLQAVALAATARPGRRTPTVMRGGGEPVIVRAAEDVVVRIIDNLLSNADRYACSQVTVAVEKVDGMAALTVADDGPGIPEAARARVFERFARLDESRSQDSGGSGLGLAIVRQLVQSIDGVVRLEDAQPGLRAVVTFPLAGSGS